MYNDIWSDEDLRDLDDKFDALAEYLGLEFVFERVSDGSDYADRSRCYARKKAEERVPLEDPAPAETVTAKQEAVTVYEEKLSEPEPYAETVPEPKSYCSRCNDLGRKCIKHRPKKGY